MDLDVQAFVLKRHHEHAHQTTGAILDFVVHADKSCLNGVAEVENGPE
jgi:hypothetical protein